MDIGQATTLFFRYGNVGRSADDLITAVPTEAQLNAAANRVRRTVVEACDTIRRFHDMPEPAAVVNFVPEPECDETDGGRFHDSYPKPQPCGKTGCPHPGHNTIVGSLTYHACNNHVDEIQRLVDSE